MAMANFKKMSIINLTYDNMGEKEKKQLEEAVEELEFEDEDIEKEEEEDI